MSRTFTVSASFTIPDLDPVVSTRLESEITLYLTELVLGEDNPDSVLDAFSPDHISGYEGPFIESVALHRNGIEFASERAEQF